MHTQHWKFQVVISIYTQNCSNLHSTQHTRVSFSYHHHFILSIFSFSYQGGNILVFHCGFNFNFLMKNGVEHTLIFIGHVDIFIGPHQVLCQLSWQIVYQAQFLYSSPNSLPVTLIFGALSYLINRQPKLPTLLRFLCNTTSCLGFPQNKSQPSSWPPSHPPCLEL